VYQLTKNIALVQTVDFFPPIVDDPFTYGAIAAANSLSDVYAMGGTPLTALNIVAFPADKPKEILKEILRGGAQKAKEAGVPIVGGHTIDDAEPKYGMAVTGLVRPGKQWTNAGAKPGDLLILTKAIGTGVITTAAKGGKATPAAIADAIASMLTLNKAASDAGLKVPPNACTDVTGFSLLGHLHGMLNASKASAVIRLSKVPLMADAWQLGAEQEISPGGTGRNKAYYEHAVTWQPGVPPKAFRLLYDPQTSGGLLFAVSKAKASRLLNALKAHRVKIAAVIGEVTSGNHGRIVVGP
jgi:selenide,water dikinase